MSDHNTPKSSVMRQIAQSLGLPIVEVGLPAPINYATECTGLPMSDKQPFIDAILETVELFIDTCPTVEDSGLESATHRINNHQASVQIGGNFYLVTVTEMKCDG